MAIDNKKIDEIQQVSLSKRTSWSHFNFTPEWMWFKLLPKKFGSYFVIHRTRPDDLFIVLDPSKFEPITQGYTSHRIAGISQEIPKSAIVGGVDLVVHKIPKIGQKYYIVEYLALHPNYQGQNLALKFYLWLINNVDITNVGIIGAGDAQSPGAVKLWKKLAQHAFVFAYSDYEKKFSHVEVGEDGELEADFEIYENPNLLHKLQQEYQTALYKIFSSSKGNDQKKAELDKKYEDTIADLICADGVHMYVTKRK
jgi:hypothetical protein